MNLYLLVMLSGVMALTASVPVAGAAEYEGILRIATEAHDEIKAQLAGTDDIPAGVAELFGDGASELEALRQAIADDDADSAERHFLLAMDIFKKIPHMISGDAVSAEPGLEGALERAEKFFDKLAGVAATHGMSLNPAELEGLFGEARQQLAAGDAEGARQSLDRINGLLADLKQELGESAQQNSTDRAKTFAQQYIDKLDGLIGEADERGYPDHLVSELVSARAKLADSTDPEQIIGEVRRVISITEHFDQSRADSMAERLAQAVDRLGALSDAEGADAESVESAQEAISELRARLTSGDYDGAQTLLDALETVLDDIENSLASN